MKKERWMSRNDEPKEWEGWVNGCDKEGKESCQGIRDEENESDIKSPNLPYCQCSRIITQRMEWIMREWKDKGLSIDKYETQQISYVSLLIFYEIQWMKSKGTEDKAREKEKRRRKW